MSRYQPLLAALLAAAVGSPTGALAKGRGGTFPDFSVADTNGDGYLTLKEARAIGIPPEQFRKEDFDHDGRIDIVQYQFGIKRDVTQIDPGLPEGAEPPGSGGGEAEEEI